jgi:hypothetical protein
MKIFHPAQILTIERALADAECIYQRMLEDKRSFGLVGYIGGIPPQIAEYFSQRFGCEHVYLPSTGTANDYRRSVAVARVLYDHFPASFRRPLSWAYRGMRRTSRMTFPQEFEFGDVWKRSRLPVLLVDDSCLTGRTLEFWRNRIRDELQRPTCTFALTTIGRFQPDYYCHNTWHSFAWRPIGV